MNKRGRYLRNYSLRGSRASSMVIADKDPREKVKDCCRKFVAFMCTQVGVGGLIVCYTVIGAVVFRKLESEYVDPSIQLVKDMRFNYTEQLWTVISDNNIFNKTVFFQDVNDTLRAFQDDLVEVIKTLSYDNKKPAEMWSFSAALMFSLSIITMIGYGNLTPRTMWGRITTMVYAVFGIPLYVLYFMNMGKVLAGCFRWIYTKIYECSTKKDENEAPKRIIVPSTACLWVIGGYIFTGAIMFANWEDWSYLDSTYFCVTSLCKLGLGDFVPGTTARTEDESKLVINFIYMLVGLGLVAMCYNLMREDIKVKVQEMQEDFGQCLEDTKFRLVLCCKRCKRDEDQYVY